jgi:hypothetical protein
VREVHTNTAEGMWTGLRMAWLICRGGVGVDSLETSDVYCNDAMKYVHEWTCRIGQHIR